MFHSLRIKQAKRDAFAAARVARRRRRQQMFAIVCTDHEPCLTLDRLYWSNADGWVPFDSRDLFAHEELLTLHLPLDGAWVRSRADVPTETETVAK